MWLAKRSGQRTRRATRNAHPRHGRTGQHHNEARVRCRLVEFWWRYMITPKVRNQTLTSRPHRAPERKGMVRVDYGPEDSADRNKFCWYLTEAGRAAIGIMRECGSSESKGG
jgi:hypothetical protein